jgi:uncharacterized protein YyaL (SSP411 family)
VLVDSGPPVPLFAGTYWPKHQFLHIATQISDAWQAKGPYPAQKGPLAEQLSRNGLRLMRAAGKQLAEQLESGSDRGFIPPTIIETTLDRLANTFERRYDKRWGGFGPAPKFPRPSEVCE